VSMDTAAQWLADLKQARPLLDRKSKAEEVTDILRDEITEGRLLPGRQLSEEEIGKALGVSRNTLRESFRLLTHERLLVHELHRGVFVRTLVQADVARLYHARRIVECAVIGELAAAGGPPALADVQKAVDDGEDAARAGRWHDVGTANMRFHQALVALAGSVRLDEFMTQLLAELRLAFYVMKDPREFHEPYLTRNRELLTVLQSGEYARAGTLLAAYLAEAESQLTAAHTAHAQ
jgi:DNA-binding GntR family transcriptional regulator